MKTDVFDYSLPESLIAQCPVARRDDSRLLVVHRAERRIEHRQFRDLPEYLRAGDTLFRNNAAVIPARLHAQRPTGGQVECLLLRPAATRWNATSGRVSSDINQTNPSGMSVIASASAEGRVPPSDSNTEDLSSEALAKEEWWCLLRPGKKLRVGATFGLPGFFTGTVREKTADGTVRVAFETTAGDILEVANRIGEMPLPPYIQRDFSSRSLPQSDGLDPEVARVSRPVDVNHTGQETHATPTPTNPRLPDEIQRAQDRERYQTVYADRGHQGAAAAPTAGLHFTPELLADLATRGIAFADLTLHVGLGTFRPIMSEHIEDHAIHREVYEIPVSTQRALASPTGRRIAVGTTSVRTIEHYLATKLPANAFTAVLAEADIYIYPPRQFAGIDCLITNFHQPRSTLLCLVSAFLTPGSTDGIAWLKEIYAEAVAREYRFFSYGDAMLIL